MGGQGLAPTPELAPDTVRCRRLLIIRLRNLAVERLGFVEQLALPRGLLGADPKQALTGEAKLLEQMLDLAHLGSEALLQCGQALMLEGNLLLLLGNALCLRLVALIFCERLSRQLSDHSLEFLVLILESFGAAHRARIIL